MLILRLAGALQSWGASSDWDDRGTEDFPTHSGIVGLLGCALGLERGDPELAELSRSFTMAIRADRPGTKSVDFQTITGNPLYNAQGKPKTESTIISSRAYLEDACFTVFLEVDNDWYARIAAALSSPKWTIYLGRKSCIPSQPVLECLNPEYGSLNEALKRYPIYCRKNDASDNKNPIQYATEECDDNLLSLGRTDNLVDGNRNFTRGKIWTGSLDRQETFSCI